VYCTSVILLFTFIQQPDRVTEMDGAMGLSPIRAALRLMIPETLDERNKEVKKSGSARPNGNTRKG
jgi:hypothetical protein